MRGRGAGTFKKEEKGPRDLRIINWLADSSIYIVLVKITNLFPVERLSDARHIPTPNPFPDTRWQGVVCIWGVSGANGAGGFGYNI
jgi:hypothetical protein